MDRLGDVAGRLSNSPDSTVAGVTDNVREVNKLLDECDPRGSVLAVDMETIVKQARLIAGEDAPLAIVLTTAFRSILGRQLKAYVSMDGLITPQREVEFSLYDSQTGASVACLQILALWPDDPLDLDLNDEDMLIKGEDRLMEMFNTAARVLGVEADR